MGNFKKVDSILYVEDEKNIQDELSDVIELFCDKLYLANNGLEGLKIFEKYNPNIIITDIKMPIMNGILFAQKVFEKSPQTHIIFVSAFSDIDYLQEAIEIHADGFVLKPIDLDKFESLLQKTIKIDHLQKEVNIKKEENIKRKAELETILSTILDGIAIIDLSYNFMYTNNAFNKILGYSIEEIKQLSLDNILNPKERISFEKIVENIIQNNFVDNYQFNINTKNQKKKIINSSLALMPDKKRILISCKDVSNEVLTQQKMEEYIHMIDENIITSSTNLKGEITYVSQAFCEISKFTKEELIGKNHNIIKDPSLSKDIYINLWETILNNKVWKGELQNKDKNGKKYWIYIKIYPIYNQDGDKTGYTSIAHDITNLKRVRELSITDALTGVYNKRYYNEMIVKFLKSAKRNKEFIGFAILDIDFFKQYNDTYGHQKGDEVLRDVAQNLKKHLSRVDDYTFRLGGEEFGILYRSSTKQKAISFAKDVIKSIEELKIEHIGNKVKPILTISGGLMCDNAENIQSEKEFYKQADDLLYEAKKAGRNQLKFNEG